MVELTAHFPFDLFLSHLVVLAVRDMHQTVAIGLTQCMKKMTDIEPSTGWFSFQFSIFNSKDKYITLVSRLHGKLTRCYY